MSLCDKSGFLCKLDASDVDHGCVSIADQVFPMANTGEGRTVHPGRTAIYHRSAARLFEHIAGEADRGRIVLKPAH